MSSKFFRTADSSSESDTDEEGQSDDEMRPQQMALSWGESSDDDKKGSRVVKSAREKRKEDVELIMLGVKVGMEKESPKAVLDGTPFLFTRSPFLPFIFVGLVHSRI
jgi:hypothetical protein